MTDCSKHSSCRSRWRYPCSGLFSLAFFSFNEEDEDEPIPMLTVFILSMVDISKLWG
jgi:hypothetical protein